jgi:hypothetical protein
VPERALERVSHGRDDAATRGAGGSRRRAAVAAAVAVLSPGTLAADPVIAPPSARLGRLGDGDKGEAPLALVAEMSAIAVLGTERETTFPAVGDLEGNEPELALVRAGLIGDGADWPMRFALRFDLAEATRLDEQQFEDHPFAVVDGFVDDFQLAWTPRSWVNVVAGRQKVAFSRFRQLEESLLTAVAPPFLHDRIAPDRRWGATVLGDLGALGYAIGGYEDVDALEPRSVPDDPSAQRGRAALTAHVEWTPRAPLGIGAGYLATSRRDPWYDTLRISGGAGILYRILDGEDRLDLSLSSITKWRFTSSLVEIVIAYDGERIAIAGAGEGGVTLADRAATFMRGEYDVEVASWSAGAGASWFVTRDRLNKLVLLGFVRRDTDGGPRRDGVVLQLQASP